MNTSNQGSKLIHFGVPAFICFYFFLAFYPKYIGNGKEITPFSLFNLYTFIPYDYSNYDLLITDQCGNSRYLFFRNEDLTPIQRKYYYTWLAETGEQYLKSNTIEFDSTHFIIADIDGQVDLVRLTGDYIETFDAGINKIEILKRIK